MPPFCCLPSKLEKKGNGTKTAHEGASVREGEKKGKLSARQQGIPSRRSEIRKSEGGTSIGSYKISLSGKKN